MEARVLIPVYSMHRAKLEQKTPARFAPVESEAVQTESASPTNLKSFGERASRSRCAGVPAAALGRGESGAPGDVGVGEIAILLHPPLPLVSVSIAMERERQQNDSLVND